MVKATRVICSSASCICVLSVVHLHVAHLIVATVVRRTFIALPYCYTVRTRSPVVLVVMLYTRSQVGNLRSHSNAVCMSYYELCELLRSSFC